MKTGERKIIGIGREVSGKRKDGSKFPVELSVSEMQLGNRVMFVGVLRDISERKKSQENLHKLSRAVEQSSSTVVITDLDGNIEYVNPKFTQTTGYTSEEAIGKNPRILKSDPHKD